MVNDPSIHPVVVRPARPPKQPPQSPALSGQQRGPGFLSRLRIRRPRTGASPVVGSVPAWSRPVLMVAVMFGLLAGIGWAIFVLNAGIDFRALEQHRSDSDTSKARLVSGEMPFSVAQSFVSPRENLSRVQLEMAAVPKLDTPGYVRLLEGDGIDGREVYSAPLSTADFSNNPYLVVSFPAIEHSAGVTYTLEMATARPTPAGSAFAVKYNTFDALSSGRLYLDGEAQRGDLAITAYYHYTPMLFVADVSNAFSTDGMLVLSWVLFLLAPGLALLLWLPNSLTFGQRLIGAPAVSVLTLPVFLLLTRALSIKLSTPAMWGIVLFSALAVLVWLVRNRRSLSISKQSLGEGAAFWAMLAGLLFLTIAGRLLPLRDAQAGMGLDAYHHTLIGEMFIRAGGIPQDYAPYASLGSFTYHYGFHAMLAAVGWLSGLTSAVDMLPLMPQAGQVAISLPVLSLTLFGWRVLGDRWAGLAAGGLAGLVSILPAFYVNWSRYTQGLGLALLPVSWVLLLEALQWKAPPVDTTGNRARWHDVTRQSGPLMLAVIGAAGLALSHYRIAMIYAAFVALYLVWVVFKAFREKQQLRVVLSPVLRTLLVAALTLAAASPWLLNLAQNFGTRFVGKSGSQGVGEDYYSLQTMGIEPLLAHPSIPLLFVLSLGGIVWVARRRDPLPLLPALTWLVLALWSNPYLLPVRLPYSGYLDSTTLATGIWLPLAILAGFSLAQFAGWAMGLGAALRKPGSTAWRLGAGTALGLAALLGGAASAWLLAPDIDRKPYIAPADVHAMTWMRDNLPESSSVLANPFAFPWDPEPKAIQGSDAGLWVPLVTGGIKSSVPPIPAYNERLSDPDYINKIREIINYEPFGEGQADWDALKRMGITHIFVGSRGGALDPNVLLKSDRTQLVWHEDSVWVFELR